MEIKSENISPWREDISLKEKEKQKVIEETKKQLNRDEFYYLKESTKQFDELKEKIYDLPIDSDVKSKLLKILSEKFYAMWNSKDKLEVIKSLNELMDKVILEYKDNPKMLVKELKNYVNQLDVIYTSSQKMESLAAIVGFISVVWGVLLGIAGYPVGLALLIFWSFATWIGGGLLEEDRDFNKFFDEINDIFPQINKKQWNQIKKLIQDGKINKEAILRLLEKYKNNDGKITDNEIKEMENFFGILEKLNR